MCDYIYFILNLASLKWGVNMICEIIGYGSMLLSMLMLTAVLIKWGDIMLGVLFLLNGVQTFVAVASVLIAASIAALVWWGD